MPHFFLLLFKINLVLLLFCATYYLVLRRLTFYTINRMFLIFGILFSSAYPFINLTDFFGQNKAVPSFVPQFNHNINQFVQQDVASVIWQWLTVLFYNGVIFMAVRLIIQFLSLYVMHKNSKPSSLNEYSIRILKDKVSPFSFWQTIYINPQLHKKQDLTNILEHEKVHVEEWHTLDIILAEICVVFYWFNPGVWLMKKAVRENIEFITDAKIIKKGIDKKSYQYSLLDVGTLRPSVALVNNFNLSDLKKRIKMMNVKRSSNATLSRYLFALPIILIISLAFTIDQKDLERSFVPLKTMVVEVFPHQKSKQQIKVLNIEKPKLIVPIAKNEKIKQPDTIRKMIFMFTHLDAKTDSAGKSIQDLLKDLPKQAEYVKIPSSKNVKGKVTMSNFTFSDSTSKGMKIIRVVVQNKSGIGQTTDSTSRKNGMVYAMTNISRVINSSDKGVQNKPQLFFINNKQVEAKELSAVNPDQISVIKMDKDGSMHISIKDKQ